MEDSYIYLDKDEIEIYVNKINEMELLPENGDDIVYEFLQYYLLRTDQIDKIGKSKSIFSFKRHTVNTTNKYIITREMMDYISNYTGIEYNDPKVMQKIAK